jgi:hypothetical protein
VKFKSDVWPVTIAEVSVCEAPVDGIVVVIEMKSRNDECASVALSPIHAKDLGEMLIRAYKDSQTLFN